MHRFIPFMVAQHKSVHAIIQGLRCNFQLNAQDAADQSETCQNLIIF